MLGHTVTVEVIPKKQWPYSDCVGIFIPESNKIQVLKQKPDQTLHNFWHEKTHAALYFMNHKMYSNEAFVDQLAGLFAQAESTRS